MYIIVVILVIIAFVVLLGVLYSAYKQKIDFFITGLDSNFSYSDLNMLWQVSQICELEQPTSLFWSMPALTKCMAHITNQAAQNNSETDPKMQVLITKLFDYRTKLQNENDDKKGLDTTLYLEKGQKLRIILPGHGVFFSKILNNGKEIIISVPRKNDLIPISAEEWDGKLINVYLWRKGDARYVFDTTVVGHGLFLGESSISLKHSSNLTRTQKRKSVRAKCEINANLYIVTAENANSTVVETQNGYQCIIEDISESGALVHIAGKGQPNIQIKLQFNIQNMLIIMCGVVKTVEYNSQINESLLHFECKTTEPQMKNEILSFVYNMLPEREREVYDAMKMTDEDAGVRGLNSEAENSKELDNLSQTEKKMSSEKGKVSSEYNKTTEKTSDSDFPDMVEVKIDTPNTVVFSGDSK